MTNRDLCALCVSFVTIGLSTVASGQTLHLPPMSRPVLPKETIVLSLQADSAGAMTGHRIGVQQNQMVVEGPTGQVDLVPLAGRTMRDVVTELRSRYASEMTTISTDFPLFSTQILEERELTPLCALAGGVVMCSTLEIKSRADAADVSFGFGLVMSPPAKRTEADTSLLASAGAALDVVGGLEFVTPKTSTTKWAPRVGAQARLALQTGQQVNVTTEQSGIVGPQVETVLQQADQIALTFQTPITFRIPKSSMDFIVTPLFGVNWTRLDPFTFPPIVVGTTQQTAASVFETTLVAQVQRELDRSLPLGERGLLGTFSFRNGETPVFYIGGGWDWPEGIERSVTFTRDTSGNPARGSLKAQVETPSQKVWRFVAGWRVLDVVDLRIDAAGPIGGRKRDPVLKVLIGRDFPMTREN